MASELSELLNTINLSKENLLRSDNGAAWEKAYVPYVVNHCMMAHIDTILIANEMNMRHGCDKVMQYEFYLNMVTPKKRFAKWLKTEKMEDLDVVKEYYNFSNRKAREALEILTREEIDNMRQVLDKGGRKGRAKTP